MNDLNHYGVKGMEWGKKKKLDVAPLGLVGNYLSVAGNQLGATANSVSNIYKNAATTAGGIGSIATFTNNSSNSTKSTTPRRSSGSNKRRSRTNRRPSSGRNSKSKKEHMVVDDVSGSFDLSNPKNTKNNPKSTKNKKKTSGKKTSKLVKSNAKTSIDSSSAMALVAQYKAFVDQLLRAFSTVNYSNQANRSTSSNVTTNTNTTIYSPGVAGPKIKTKKRG